MFLPAPKQKLPAVLLVGSVLLTLLAFTLRDSLLQPRVMPETLSCLANLKQIDGAVQQWANVSNQPRIETYSLTNPAILQWLKGSILPKCPQGGNYSPGHSVADFPTCSIPGHTL